MDMVRNLICGGIFFFGLVAAWGLTELHWHIQEKKRKKEIRERAIQILERKAALRKAKEDEAWADYVSEINQEMRNEFGDNRQAG